MVFVELEVNDATLAVEERIAKRSFSKDRGNFCVNNGAAITLFDRAAPIGFIPIRMDEFRRKLTDLGLGFLKTNNVVFFSVKPIEEAFTLGSADSVDVPGYKRDAFRHVGRIADGNILRNRVSYSQL